MCYLKFERIISGDAQREEDEIECSCPCSQECTEEIVEDTGESSGNEVGGGSAGRGRGEENRKRRPLRKKRPRLKTKQAGQEKRRPKYRKRRSVPKKREMEMETKDNNGHQRNLIYLRYAHRQSEDITLRVLRYCKKGPIACEDTRRTRQLLGIIRSRTPGCELSRA